MKKVRKIISVILLLVILIPQSALANTSTEKLDAFKEIIYNLQEYRMFASEIKSEFVSREALTDEGVRLTVAFNLSDIDGYKTLIFVADESFNIIFSGLVESNEEIMRITNFESKTTELLDIGKLVIDTCYTDICVRDRIRIQTDPKPGCNLMVGGACKSLLSVPGYGPIMQAICKGGVFILCNFSATRICVEYERFQGCME